MGRARKPIETQTGHLTVGQQQQREQEEQLSAGKVLAKIKPPKALINAEARKLWKWAVGLMKDMPLVGELDVLNLEGLCNAFALYRGVTAKIKDVTKECVEFGDEALTLMNAQKKYAEEYRAFARLCGFTVDSRLKLAAVKSKELDDNITEEFGNI